MNMDAPEPLILDLLLSLQKGPRPYDEIMEAWRTSCPRLPVWEDAIYGGLVRSENGMVRLTAKGHSRIAAMSTVR